MPLESDSAVTNEKDRTNEHEPTRNNDSIFQDSSVNGGRPPQTEEEVMFIGRKVAPFASRNTSKQGTRQNQGIAKRAKVRRSLNMPKIEGRNSRTLQEKWQQFDVFFLHLLTIGIREDT